jgi:serine/threonine-protein kinase
MSLAAGTRLGPYEIVSPIGAGGMGEVFRATDTKLKRDVAIKVLPAAFTEDKERLARFEREAQLLAQLHHPNIASIFAMEKWGQAPFSSALADDGAQSVPVPIFALVMELVEGPTLAERLEHGPLPFNESLSVSLQIAHALEEAHEKGIVHRDLKPQNIKASIEGKVKVLDFGLAKAMDPTSAASGGAASASLLAKSPTLTMGATVQGMILGTAAYMSPEQAKGFPVDKRADIWAFGVLLYEMLCGGTLFAGDSVGDTLAAVIRADIDLDRLPAETPPAIRHLLRRCLERNPKNRLHDIADARIVIDEVIAGVAEPAASPSALAAEPATKRPRWLAPAVAAAVLAAGFASGWLLRGGRPEPAARGVQVALALPPELTLVTQDLLELDLSADGRRQVVTVVDRDGETHLLLRDLGDVAPRLLPGTEGARSPFLSPDAQSVGFFVGSEVRRMAVAGGPALRVATTVNVLASRGATWGHDGFIYFIPDTATGVQRVRANGGTVETVTRPDPARNERTHRWPSALADGSAVLFTCDTTESTEYYDDARIEAVRVATGERKVLIEGSSQARFLPPDRLVFARQGALFAVEFDPRSLEVRGAPVLVAQNVATDVASGAVQFAISTSGDLAWFPGEAVGGELRLQWLSPEGGVEDAGLRPGIYTQIALSPDGRRVALTDASAGNLSLWVGDFARSSLSRLTFDGSASDPVWSPDGRRVAYADTVASRIAWKPADGSGVEEALFDRRGEIFPSSFSPDGKLLVVEIRNQGAGTVNQSDIWLRALDGSGADRAYSESPQDEYHAEVSPDGRWIAYTSLESGIQEVYLRPFPSGGGKWQVSTAGGAEPHWSSDGRKIYFRSGAGIFDVELGLAGGVELGAPRLLGATGARGTLSKTFAVAPDGRVLKMQRSTESASARQVNLALGWRGEVDRLLAPQR